MLTEGYARSQLTGATVPERKAPGVRKEISSPGVGFGGASEEANLWFCILEAFLLDFVTRAQGSGKGKDSQKEEASYACAFLSPKSVSTF